MDRDTTETPSNDGPRPAEPALRPATNAEVISCAKPGCRGCQGVGYVSIVATVTREAKGKPRRVVHHGGADGTGRRVALCRCAVARFLRHGPLLGRGVMDRETGQLFVVEPAVGTVAP